MATITDLPCALMYYILYLLVKSSGGAADCARILSVCRNFRLYAEDVSVLRIVNFNIKMNFVNFYDFQNVKGLLVKCAEAGNIAAQHVLGKVILLSSTHLLLSEREREIFGKRGLIGRNKIFGLCGRDHFKLKRILDRNVHAQNSKVSSFMNYFSPLQVCTSGSPTRLVHHQLVKLFLINGNYDDFIEMGIFLRFCIWYLMGTREHCALITSIKKLVKRAFYVEDLTKTKESFSDCFRIVRELLEPNANRSENYKYNISMKYRCVIELCMLKCHMEGLGSREALSDADFAEALRQEVNDQLGESYIDLGNIRAVVLGHFEDKFG